MSKKKPPTPPLQATPHPADKVVRLTKMLACQLSGDEIRERGREHAKAAQEIAEEDDRQKRARRDMKERLDELKEVEARLRNVVINGSEERLVPVEERYQLHDYSILQTRLDTGETFFVRTMTVEERESLQQRVFQWEQQHDAGALYGATPEPEPEPEPDDLRPLLPPPSTEQDASEERLEALVEAYSGAWIAEKGRIKKPVLVDGVPYTVVSVGSGAGGIERVTAHRLYPADAWPYQLTPLTYADAISDAYAERRAKTGLYQGLSVSYQKTAYVLGEEVRFLPPADELMEPVEPAATVTFEAPADPFADVPAAGPEGDDEAPLL